MQRQKQPFPHGKGPLSSIQAPTAANRRATVTAACIARCRMHHIVDNSVQRRDVIYGRLVASRTVPSVLLNFTVLGVPGVPPGGIHGPTVTLSRILAKRHCFKISGLSYLRSKSVEMDDYCILLALPEVIAGDVLSKWIGFKNIARLDSAFCNTQARAIFSSLAYSKQVLYSSPCYDIRQPREVESALCWGIKRGAVFGVIWVAKMFVMDHDFRTKVLKNSGSAVRTLNASRYIAQMDNATVLTDIASTCPNVEAIHLVDIGSTALKAGLPAIAQNCRKLTTLVVGSLQSDNPTLCAALKECRSLTHLKLSGRNMTVPVEVALPTLTHLDIAECLVPDETAVAIGQHCAGLKTLRIFNPIDSQSVQDTGVQALLQGCPHVDWSIQVRWAEGISTDLRVEMARRCSFTRLEFKVHHWLDSSASLVQGVLRNSPGLTELHASDSYRKWREPSYLDDAAAAVAAQHCPSLKVVYCHRTPIGDAGVGALARHCRALEDVTLVECPRVTTQGLRSLLQHCTALKKLHLGYLFYKELPLDLKSSFLGRGIQLSGADIVWRC